MGESYVVLVVVIYGTLSSNDKLAIVRRSSKTAL